MEAAITFVTDFSLNLHAPPTPVGFTVLVAVTADNTSAVTVSDPRGNVYTENRSITLAGAYGPSALRLFSTTVTTALQSGDPVNVSGSGTQVVMAVIFSGLASSPFDTSAASSGLGGSSASVGPTPTTAQPNELVLFVDGLEGPGTPAATTPTPGFTYIGSYGAASGPNTVLIGMSYRIVSASGAYSANVSFAPGNPDWKLLLGTYKEAPAADLAITKTDGQTTAVAGQPVTYTIVASNAGPSAVTGATVADTVPAAITGATWTCASAAGGTCAASGSGNINDTVNLPVGGTVTYTLTGTINPSATGSLSNTATVTAPGGVTDPNPANNSATDTDPLVGLDFFSLPPCRVVDTRGGAPIGGPVMQGQETRAFTVAGNCGIPLTAKAVSINLTVTAASVGGNVRLFPAGQPVPTASTINYVAGQNRANNAVIPLDASGALAAFVAQPAGTTVHLIIDVNGYFE